MRLERAKNAKKNIIMGFINKIVAIFFPFLVRTILIKKIGVDYLGLDGLFTSILNVLSMAEMGLSSAIVYSMYKPIAEEDTDTICALLNFYKKVYRGIGLTILIIGVLLVPFLDKFIYGAYPEELNLTLLYLIYLCNTVLSYFLFSYLSALITAYQRNDLINIVNIIITVLLNMAQVCVIVINKNYYVYAILLPLFTIVHNLLIGFVARKYYPQYECRGKIPKNILKDIKIRVSGLVISKVCNTSRNAFDSIFISAFLGLTISAMYNNYYYILSAITAILGIISHSIF